MINPSDIIKFDRTDDELLELMLFYIMVAGKRSDTTAVKLEKFLDLLDQNAKKCWCCGNMNLTLEEKLNHAAYDGVTLELLREVKAGKYELMWRAIQYLTNKPVDLRKGTPEELEKVPGVGPKTSRVFIMQSREDAKYAALDTHILAEMREWGVDAPISTPSFGRLYRDLEKTFIQVAEDLGKSPAMFDLEIWVKRSGNG